MPHESSRHCSDNPIATSSNYDSDSTAYPTEAQYILRPAPPPLAAVVGKAVADKLKKRGILTIADWRKYGSSPATDADDQVVTAELEELLENDEKGKAESVELNTKNKARKMQERVGEEEEDSETAASNSQAEHQELRDQIARQFIEHKLEMEIQELRDEMTMQSIKLKLEQMRQNRPIPQQQQSLDLSSQDKHVQESSSVKNDDNSAHVLGPAANARLPVESSAYQNMQIKGSSSIPDDDCKLVIAELKQQLESQKRRADTVELNAKSKVRRMQERVTEVERNSKIAASNSQAELKELRDQMAKQSIQHELEMEKKVQLRFKLTKEQNTN